MFDGLMTDDPFVLPQTVSTPMPFQSSTRVIGWALLQVQNNVAPLRLYTKLCPLEILTIKNQQCHFSTHMIYQSIYIYIILYIYIIVRIAATIRFMLQQSEWHDLNWQCS